MSEPDGIVLWHTTMSLDGFIAAPGDEMDWVFEYFKGPNPVAREAIETTGAVLVGRRSYDVGVRERRRDPDSPAARIYGDAWTGPQFVLTHRPSDLAEDPDVTFVSDDASTAVGRALAAAGGRNVVIIGATVARNCLEAGLVDEILVHLAPVLLGDGTRIYGDAGGEAVKLEKIGVTEAGPITNLRFRVLN